MRPEFSFRLAELSINSKNGNDVTIFWHDVIVIFRRSFVSLFKFSYWFKFHFKIITGSGFMTIFSFLHWAQNLDIGNTLVWFLPNNWRLRWVKDIRLDKNVSREMLQYAAKCQGYSFYRFWVIKGKPTGSKFNHPPPRLRLKKKRIIRRYVKRSTFK